MIRPSEADVGREVTYCRAGCPTERGVIFAVNPAFVIVDYESGRRASLRQDLIWADGSDDDAGLKPIGSALSRVLEHIAQQMEKRAAEDQ